MALEFDLIQLDGATVRGWLIEPNRKITLRLTDPAGFPEGGGGAYDLQFIRVADFKLKSDDIMLCNVVSHKMLAESNMLSAVRGELLHRRGGGRVDERSIRHFTITFDAGQLDVIAESFSYDLIWTAR